jgi:hypothetical protein
MFEPPRGTLQRQEKKRGKYRYILPTWLFGEWTWTCKKADSRIHCAEKEILWSVKETYFVLESTTVLVYCVTQSIYIKMDVAFVQRQGTLTRTLDTYWVLSMVSGCMLTTLRRLDPSLSSGRNGRGQICYGGPFRTPLSKRWQQTVAWPYVKKFKWYMWYIWYIIYDMIWYDMIWCDMIWYMIWYDMIW